MPLHFRKALAAAGGLVAVLLFVPARADDPAPSNDPPQARTNAEGQAEGKLSAVNQSVAPATATKDAAAKVEKPVPADLIGVIKESNADAKRMVVIEDGTGKERIVVITEQTAITFAERPSRNLIRGKKLNPALIKPGSRVVIRQTIPAAAIQLTGQTMGSVTSVDAARNVLVLMDESTNKRIELPLAADVKVIALDGTPATLATLEPSTRVAAIREGSGSTFTKIVIEDEPESILQEFWENFRHNLFKPLLLFFYMGFLVPILGVKFEFPYVMYQGLTIFLLIAIGWHGGEELSGLKPEELAGAFGFMGVGLALNFVIGILAYLGLTLMAPKMRRVDKATVAGYYGSDSAGTFVTCLGVLATAGIAFAPYMPVMLAVMEIPGCLVALYLVSRLRHKGMDPVGHMPDEPGYDPNAVPPASDNEEYGGHGSHKSHGREELALEKVQDGDGHGAKKAGGFLTPQLLHEVFLNPGLYLLFGGIAIGFVSGLQGAKVTRDDDKFFVELFNGILCLFLLEMGMTASRKLKDLKRAGPGFIAFGLLAPNVFATLGILTAHLYSHLTHTPFELGTYVLFSVLCGAASYIAVPAVQRLAIPEASPTLPLAASLGLTFSYNVTIGIPVYIEISKYLMRALPV